MSLFTYGKREHRAYYFIRAFVLPRVGHDRDDFEIIKEQRMRHRLEEINNIIKAQNYYEWLAAQKEEDSKTLIATDPLWYGLLHTTPGNLQLMSR